MKYWPTNDPNQYRLSKRLSVDNTSYLVCDLSPRVEYSFQVLWVSQNKSHEWIFVWLLQVIAVEEKGQWGVDYNRGETTSYTIGGLLKNKNFCKKRGFLILSIENCWNPGVKVAIIINTTISIITQVWRLTLLGLQLWLRCNQSKPKKEVIETGG